MYDIIIIGAGPAGLTSAIYASRALKKTLVLEAVAYGGQILNTLDIENYPAEEHISGFDFATKLYNQAINLGAEVKFEKATNIIDKEDYKEIITTKSSYQAKAVIILPKTVLGEKSPKPILINACRIYHSELK